MGPRLDDARRATIRSSCDRCSRGRLDDVLASVKALHAAGVDLLVGTGAAVPFPSFGGVAHSAGVHHELQFLVRAGPTPVEAPRAATSVPARCAEEWCRAVTNGVDMVSGRIPGDDDAGVGGS